jgi:hypothetical protein
MLLCNRFKNNRFDAIRQPSEAFVDIVDLVDLVDIVDTATSAGTAARITRAFHEVCC